VAAAAKRDASGRKARRFIANLEKENLTGGIAEGFGPDLPQRWQLGKALC
jgi:hypothetical protein